MSKPLATEVDHAHPTFLRATLKAGCEERGCHVHIQYDYLTLSDTVCHEGEFFYLPYQDTCAEWEQSLTEWLRQQHGEGVDAGDMYAHGQWVGEGR